MQAHITDKSNREKSLNQDLANLMREIADRLQRRGESPFRVAAFRRAGATFGRCERDIAALFAEQGEAGLCELPAVGQSIARVAAGFLRLGRSQKLERLRQSDDDKGLLCTLPGVGPQIAKRVEA